jgi:predicted phosphate transport protein (TIGR00153 family)
MRVYMFGLKKKEDVFLELFIESSAKVIVVGDVFHDLVHNYENVEDKVSNLKILETDCDIQAHKILKKLNESFITPFDREDIYNLARDTDDIVDCLEEVANRFLIFDVKEMKPDAIIMTNLIVQCIRELDVLFKHLKEIKTNTIVREQIIEVNRIENEGDIVYRRALTKLFKNEKDPIEIIKWKQLYELLEESMDSCENVANIVEGLVMKHA